MVTLRNELESRLKEELAGWQKVVILGIGSELSGDDSLGLLVAKKLKKALAGIAEVKVFTSGSCPENFTGLLRRLSPSHILLVDAAETGETAGTIKIVEPNGIEEVTPSTHTLPLSMLVKYLEQELSSKILVLGVQPERLSFGATLSEQVEDAVDNLVNLLEHTIELTQVSQERINGPKCE